MAIESILPSDSGKVAFEKTSRNFELMDDKIDDLSSISFKFKEDLNKVDIKTITQSGIYRLISCTNTPCSYGVLEVTNLTGNLHYTVIDTINNKMYIMTRRDIGEWTEWQQIATTKTDILTNTLVNGWVAKYGDVVLNVTGNQAVITGTLGCGTLTDGTAIMTVPSKYKPTTRTSHCTIGTLKGNEQGTFTIYTDGTIKYRGGSITGATDIAFCFTYILY